MRALGEAGHSVLFLTALRQYPAWLYPGATDRDPDAVPRTEGTQPCLDPLRPLSWRQARRLAVDANADAWIFPYWTWVWAPMWRFLLATPSRPPAVAVVHNPADHDAGRLHRLVARRLLRRCDGLFTHARVLAEQLHSEYPAVPVGHSLLPASPPGPLPARSASRSALGLPEDARVALFLGLIRPYKGVDLLVEAWADRAVSADWHLVVAGEPWGDGGTVLTAKVAELGLGDRVHLRLGWVPEGEVPALLAAADLVVLPYRSGSQSAVAPLALAHGVPVLTTAVGGVPELVADGVNGVVVPPGSVGALAQALGRLDRGLLHQLADGAVARGLDSTWETYGTALIRHLSDVLIRWKQKRPPERAPRI